MDEREQRNGEGAGWGELRTGNVEDRMSQDTRRQAQHYKLEVKLDSIVCNQMNNCELWTTIK